MVVLEDDHRAGVIESNYFRVIRLNVDAEKGIALNAAQLINWGAVLTGDKESVAS